MKYLIPFLLSALALFACASGFQKREAEAEAEADPTFPIRGNGGVVLSSPNAIRRVYHIYKNKHGTKHYRYRHGGTRKTKRRIGKRSSGDASQDDHEGSGDSIKSSYVSQDSQPFYYNYLEYSKRSADSPPDGLFNEDRDEDLSRAREDKPQNKAGNSTTAAPDNNSDIHLFHRDFIRYTRADESEKPSKSPDDSLSLQNFIHHTKRSADPDEKPSSKPDNNPDGNLFHQNFLHYTKRSADPTKGPTYKPDNNPYNHLFHRNFLQYTKRSIADSGRYDEPYTSSDFVVNVLSPYDQLIKRSAFYSYRDDLRDYENPYGDDLKRYDDLAKRNAEVFPPLTGYVLPANIDGLLPSFHTYLNEIPHGNSHQRQ